MQVNYDAPNVVHPLETSGWITVDTRSLGRHN